MTKKDDAKKAPEVPSFTLQAGDYDAANTIRAWAERMRHQGPMGTADTSEATTARYIEAYNAATAIDRFNRGEG